MPTGHQFDEVANAIEAAGLMERVETKAEEEEDDESDPNESDTSQKTEEYTLTAHTSDTGEEVQVVVNKDGSSFVAEPAKSQSPTPTPSSPQSLPDTPMKKKDGAKQ